MVTFFHGDGGRGDTRFTYVTGDVGTRGLRTSRGTWGHAVYVRHGGRGDTVYIRHRGNGDTRFVFVVFYVPLAPLLV